VAPRHEAASPDEPLPRSPAQETTHAAPAPPPRSTLFLALIALALPALLVCRPATHVALGLACVDHEEEGYAILTQNDSLQPVEFFLGCGGDSFVILSDGTVTSDGELEAADPWTYFFKTELDPVDAGGSILHTQLGRMKDRGPLEDPTEHFSRGLYAFLVPENAQGGDTPVRVTIHHALFRHATAQDLAFSRQVLLRDAEGNLLADLSSQSGSEEILLEAGTYLLFSQLELSYRNLGPLDPETGEQPQTSQHLELRVAVPKSALGL
jgi:hypothetical protein